MALRDIIKYDPDKVHTLKNRSSYIVVVLKSLFSKCCICCGEPINSLEESFAHWDEKLNLNKEIIIKPTTQLNLNI